MIWIFTESEGDGIESWLPSSIFSTLKCATFIILKDNLLSFYIIYVCIMFFLLMKSLYSYQGSVGFARIQTWVLLGSEPPGRKFMLLNIFSVKQFHFWAYFFFFSWIPTLYSKQGGFESGCGWGVSHQEENACYSIYSPSNNSIFI